MLVDLDKMQPHCRFITRLTHIYIITPMLRRMSVFAVSEPWVLRQKILITDYVAIKKACQKHTRVIIAATERPKTEIFLLAETFQNSETTDFFFCVAVVEGAPLTWNILLNF